ncbi:MAG: hypothetical protein VX874_12385 [Pseudomonadota bacterium]|nr:hypothetical protein [Pseudomonadota bacterium]
MLNDDKNTARDVAHIKALIAAEIEGFDPKRHTGIEEWNEAILADFKAALIDPELMEVNLAGGITDFAYAVTETKGPYRVFWLPWSDIFSLAVESRFGPCDISVHGDAIGCFASV